MLFSFLLLTPAFASEAGDFPLDKPSYLMKDQLTFGNTHVWGAYNNNWGYSFDESKTTDYEINALNVGADSDFGKIKTRVMFNYNPYSDRPIAQQLWADMYVQSTHIPHHTVTVGNQRPPVGYEGGMSPYTLDFFGRSQVARKFGTVRKLGASIKGDYEHADYNLGVYSSDTYFQSFFPGAEFVGSINLKNKTKYGDFNVGYSLDAGKRGDSFCVNGVHAGYNYKKFGLDAEYMTANNYNGPSGELTHADAHGFYTTAKYMVTPKVQVLAEYDQFTQASKTKRYVVAGINYFIKGQALKAILNYYFSPDDHSHRLLFGFQVLL